MIRGARNAVPTRSVFISDLHLGTRDCRAKELAEFLRNTEMETLFLVGDVVDLWSMRRGIYWPVSHQDVVRLIIDKVRRGTRVIYIPGNHDELARALCGSLLAGVEVHAEYEHTTRTGQRLLVMHGDAFDGAVRFSPLLKATGSALYTMLLWVGRYVNLARGLFGLPHWSLAAWLKSRVGDAREYVQRFERAAAHEARRRGFDGIVCGHIHRPQVQRIDGVLYCNDGDWVDHCTALIEDRHGELSLWSPELAEASAPAPVPQVREAA